MTASSEDAIIHQRLLLKEGHLNNVTKKFITLKNHLQQENPDQKQSEQLYQSFLRELDVYEFLMRKTSLVLKTNEREREQYTELHNERVNDINQAKESIEVLKVELEEAKRQRQNKEEYVALGSVISEFPATQQSESEMEKLNAEIQELNTQVESITEKLDLRTKQFQLLLHSLHELQSSV